MDTKPKIEAMIMLTKSEGYWKPTYNGAEIIAPRDMQRIARGLKNWYKQYLRGLNYGPKKILTALEKARKAKDAEAIKGTQTPEGTK
jgi:hypothetical protein